jgi:hypothetical protein
MSKTAEERSDDAMPYQMWGFGLGAAAIFIVVLLLAVPIGNRAVLVGLYITVFVTFTLALHLLMVTVPNVSGAGITARAPKYLEYAYTILISLALVQIFLSSPKILEYFEDANDQFKFLKQEAQKKLTECRQYTAPNGKKDPNIFYTSDYCQKLEMITTANDFDDVALTKLDNDPDFTRFVIGMVFLDRLRPIYSDIPYQLHRLLALKALRADASDRKSDPLAWISIVLLPIGIALRITKTSLELFGKLNPST